MEYIKRLTSPVGELTLASDGESLTGLWIAGQKYHSAGLAPDAAEAQLPVFAAAAEGAEAGARASEGFASKFGRARSYGDATIGTPDAGAVSTSLFLRGLATGAAHH